MYGVKSKQELCDYFAVESQQNQKEISSTFESDINIVVNLLNLQYKIASQHMWSLDNNLFNPPDDSRILFGAFHRNLFSFFTSNDLNSRGFPGSARIILRNVFEYLLFAKYSSLSQNKRLFKSWINGEKINLTNNVLNKIKDPDISSIIKLWDLLCSYSHSSIYSQQIVIDWKTHSADIAGNFIFLRLLLECNYHLLSSHLINSTMRYYSEKYGDRNYIRSLKKGMRDIIKESKKNMQIEPRKFIYTYKKSWKIIE